jgi:CHAT domain
VRRLLDFDVVIEPHDDGFRSRVVGSPAGEAEADFAFPFSDKDLQILVLEVVGSIGRVRRQVRRIDSPDRLLLERFGDQLFRAVFCGPVGECLGRSRIAADSKDAGLRIRLRLPQPLLNIPWEYLYDEEHGFLGLDPDTALVRYPELPNPVKPFPVSPPLRILAMISAPSDLPELDVEQEWAKLNSTLHNLVDAGMAQVDRLENGTLSALRQQLTVEKYHVLHFIGHGGFDEQGQDGALALESAEGKTRLVTGRSLGMMVHHRTLRLAVLNACEGDRSAPDDPFSGVAQGLVRSGIPAVIAMQFEISDPAALVFSQSFYQGIADGLPIDAATVEARRAIFADGNEVEWATPVLYLRSPDGRVFTRGQRTIEQREAERLAAERREAERLAAERREAERLAAERREAERLAAERREAERLAAEQREAEQREAEQREAEQREAEQREAEQREAEQREAEQREAEQREAEQREAEQREAERLETERREAERLEAERLEAERLEALRLEAQRLETQRLETQRLETQRLETQRLEAQRLEAQRREAGRLETQRREAEEREARRIAAAQRPTVPVAGPILLIVPLLVLAVKLLDPSRPSVKGWLVVSLCAAVLGCAAAAVESGRREIPMWTPALEFVFVWLAIYAIYKLNVGHIHRISHYVPALTILAGVGAIVTVVLCVRALTRSARERRSGAKRTIHPLLPVFLGCLAAGFCAAAISYAGERYGNVAALASIGHHFSVIGGVFMLAALLAGLLAPLLVLARMRQGPPASSEPR